MIKELEKPLFIFEMANNHQGNIEHGMRIIHEIAKSCEKFPFKFAFKFQYRDLESFIHPLFREREDIKLVKRFQETRLEQCEFIKLKDEVKKRGFLSICTAFDEKSVELIDDQNFDIIKIASCSFTDWPLLEKISTIDKPIIASTAGAPLEEIDNVVSFFRHRNKELALMHCVAEYPTPLEHLELNQISFLKKRYPDLKIGYSTHESPDFFDAVKIAIGQGAEIFEKHVGSTTGGVTLNAYSATAEQIAEWLEAANKSWQMCGVLNQRPTVNEKEVADLRALARGVFAKKKIKKGEKIDLNNTFFAMPSIEGQLVANDMGKYNLYHAMQDIDINEPVLKNELVSENIRVKIVGIITRVKEILQESKTVIPNQIGYELSHHFGLEQFDAVGATIINCINREYCKKIIVMIPGQKHPGHLHKIKEESFCVLHGELMLTLNGKEKTYKPGDIVVVERGVEHSFWTKTGVVFEEISTHHVVGDSYYENQSIMEARMRKTNLTYWFED